MLLSPTVAVIVIVKLVFSPDESRKRHVLEYLVTLIPLVLNKQ